MMYRLLFLLSLITLISCKDESTLTIDCLSSGLQNGLVAFYPFNGGSLKDAAPGQYDLTNPTTAAPGADRNGSTNCAFQFNNVGGGDEFLTYVNPSFLDNMPVFSLSAWYKPSLGTDGGSYQVLLSRGETLRCPDRRGEWSLGLYDCYRAVFGHNNSVWADPVTNPLQNCLDEMNQLANSWHHVVAVMNNGTYKIYFDGQLQTTNTGDANCGSPTYHAQDIGDMLLGKYFTGSIDDVLIYDRELNAQEVTELFGLTGCCN